MKNEALLLEKKTKKKSVKQLVLFNKHELDILNHVKPSYKALENIKRVKHLFHGELVDFN